jgi:hypothetical protein
MSKPKKKLETNNDFWNDCLKENKKPKKFLNTKINPSPNYLNKAKRNKKLYRHDTNPTFFKSKIIQNALISEENTLAENNKAVNESIDYMVSLYKRALESQEKKKKNIIETREKHLKVEKEECSFKPKQFKNKSMQKLLKKHFDNLNIYERSLKFQEKHLEKMAKLFEEKNKKNNVVYSFQPEITNKNLNLVFFSSNFCKEQADNDSNKIFLSRQMKAREEEQYKKNCYENKLGKNRDMFGYHKRLKKSLSQKDSLLYRNNLHNTIINLKCFQSNDDSNNENKNGEFFLV